MEFLNFKFTDLQQALIYTILAPLAVTVIKVALSEFFDDLSTYMNRRFDEDGDPGIGKECYLETTGRGRFEKVIVKDYTFGIFGNKRNVVTIQKAPDGNGVIVVPYTYKRWKSMLKGSINKELDEVVKNI